MVNTSFDVRVLDVEELISELLAKTAESNTCMAFCHVHVRKSMLLMRIALYACIPQLAAETHVQTKKYIIARSAMRKRPSSVRLPI